MKKRMFLIVAVMLIFVCAVCMTACSNKESGGKSAYELAVENGFQGTVEEWLDSLKGTNGKDGVDGKNGTNGIDGTDGKDGTTYFTIAEYYDAAVKAGYDKDILTFIKESVGANVKSEQAVVAKNLLSSVAITCVHEVTSTDIFGNSKTQSATAGGSGVIYKLDKSKGDAYVITNFHVVYESTSNAADKISTDIGVYLYASYTSEQKIPATYVGGSMNYDIAVLKIEGSEILKNSSAEAAEFADSNEVAVGQTAIAVGNAKGSGISVTSGIVSVDSENLTMTGADDETTVKFRVMRVDCAINKGNSGGGLFDADGKLIGIVNAKMITTDVENIGYAIPSNIVEYVAENVIYNASQGYSGVKKALLGITVISNEPRAVYDAENGKTVIEETVTVYENADEGAIIEESALAYGKLFAGDVIKSVAFDRQSDGTDGYGEEIAVTRSYQVVDLMLTVRPGDKIKITVLRPYTEGETTAYKQIEAEITVTEESVSEVK